MKMIYISCNVAVQEQVIDLLDQCSVTNYQLIDVVASKSNVAVPRLNTPTWPGYNSAIIGQIEELDVFEKTVAALRAFNKEAFNADELVLVSSWEVDLFFNN